MYKPFLAALSSSLLLSVAALAQATVPEAVVVTRDPSEVKGLAKVGEVEGRSPFFGLTAKKGAKDATQKLREEAAKIGATTVLIVHEDAMGATTLQGLAYRGAAGKATPAKAVSTSVGGSWESVLITRDPAEVKGLKKAGEIEGRSPFFGLTAKKGDKDARKKLQEAAAALGATKVLIVHEDTMGATTLQGIAYK